MQLHNFTLLVFSLSMLFLGQGKTWAVIDDPAAFVQANSLPVAEQIKRHRMGTITIEVVNSRHQPVPDLEVRIEQIKHEFEFGTALSSQMFTTQTNIREQAQYFNLAKQLFNSSVHENALKWYATEPQRGQVSYADADQILSWSETNALPLRGHTLFWEVEQWNPPWLKSLSNQELQLAVERRATEICRRYRGRIREYDVLNEMLHGNFFRQRLGPRIVKTMFQRCQAIDPGVTLYVNDFDILNGKRLNDYVEQIRDLRAQGVLVGGIGIQAHFLKERITPEQIRYSLDTLAQFNLPIKLTEFSALADTEPEQAKILLELYQTAFAHPSVKGILMWGFWEPAHWVPKAAIFGQNFKPKLAAKVYQELVFNQWWTRTQGVTNQYGKFTTRAFFGQYRILVKDRKRLETRYFSFRSHSAQPTVFTLVVPLVSQVK